MSAVRTVVQSAVAPRDGIALDRALLARARTERVPLLHVWSGVGDVLLIGRFHQRPSASADVVRRRSGGRAVPSGAGFVQVSLALPHRSALESDDPYALGAEQVLNRAVRGVMGGLELLGVEPYYPGRDLVTVGGKPIAWISLAVEDDGATLVEAGVSVARDFSLLAPLADRVDPDGLVPVTLWQPDDVTSVARLQGGRAASAAVAAAIVEGYRRRLGWEIVADESLTQRAAGDEDDGVEAPVDGGCGRRAIMLGTLMAYVRRATDGTLAAVHIRGDFIAPGATVTAIEQALAGQPPVASDLERSVAAVLALPAHFLLGASAEDVVGAVLVGAGR
jgi:lipoate-protein ligase A